MKKLNNRSYTVALPKEVRNLLKLDKNDNIEYFIKNDIVTIKKFNNKEEDKSE